MVTAGSNMGFLNAVLAIADPGDEIILPTPYYFNHEMAVTMASCKPVLVPTDSAVPPAAGRAGSGDHAAHEGDPDGLAEQPDGVVFSEASLRAVNEVVPGAGHLSHQR